MHSHLFDALTADEISKVSDIIRNAGTAGSRPGFGAVYAEEPDKWRLRDGQVPPRRARAIVLDRHTGATYDILVDLETEMIEESIEVEHGAAPLLEDEIKRVADLLKKDPQYIAALAKRGITDLDQVQIDPWSVANRSEIETKGTRPWGTVSYLRHWPEDNGYAHPIEGVIATVDLVSDTVMTVIDYGVRPMNPEHGNYQPEHNQPMREDIAPLEITQPEGVGFTLQGNAMEWQKWRFRINMHPLEGLILHDVGYRDGDHYRSIMHRASLSEMVVPYGEPSPEHYWRSAFDAGEFGLGRLANSLTLGCDCVGEIVYVDAVFAADDGSPRWIKNAICIHEEDAGILWKHTDVETGNVDVRRSRRLVVSSIATIGNYHYGFYWNFYQDGSIQVEVKLLGVVQTRAVEDGEEVKHGTRIGPNLVATYHQHLFTFRLDMAVDGWQNSVFQNDAHGLPTGEGNPHGNAIAVTRTPIKRESDGDGFTNQASARNWTVVNPSRTNRWGAPVGYKLLPGWAASTLIAHEPSLIAKRAQFATRNVWVSRYAQDEVRAGGNYPNADRSGAGLGQWAAADRDVENTDVVLWHTVGVTHIPRSEDWPVMPTEVAGFHLLPVNFFDENPALDVPPSKAHGTGEHAHCHTEAGADQPIDESALHNPTSGML